MKQLLLFHFIVIVVTTASAQKIVAANVPIVVKTGFSKAHANAKGRWEREGGAYEVNFKEGGKSMSCVIDKNGTIQETETGIQISELPAAIKTYVAQQYKPAPIKEAARIVKADGVIVYEANVEGKDLLFSEDGTFIKADKE